MAGASLQHDVHVAFKPCQLFMEASHLHAVLDLGEVGVGAIDFCVKKLVLGVECGPSFMVAAVPLDFGVGSGVGEVMGHFSQGVVLFPFTSEEPHKPGWCHRLVTRTN